jgi:two-component system NtrC family response regulator
MQNNSILIIDDEENLRKLMARIIKLEGYTVFEAPTAKEGLRILEKESIQVVISDVKLPDINGIVLTSKIKEAHPTIEIIVLTAYGTIEDGVQAMKNGAFDYLIKGDNENKLVPLVAKAVEKAQLQQKIKELELKLNSKTTFDAVIGKSGSLKSVVDQAKKVAKTDTTVLLTGETGTGKEVFAQAIHSESLRKGKSFVPLNCSAFAKDLIESELFGYKAGAFTGANKDKKGLFEEAHEGTIFLDEIGEMSIDLQAKLLRVLETQEFTKVGDTKPTKVSVRVIAATNKDLQEESKKGNFRLDLYYRLSVFQIRLPSLQERTEDIEMLGNIRELKNVIERAVILCDASNLDIEQLPFDFYYKIDSAKSTLNLAELEKSHISRVLILFKGNKVKVAEVLGIGLTTLYRKIEEYHIEL